MIGVTFLYLILSLTVYVYSCSSCKFKPWCCSTHIENLRSFTGLFVRRSSKADRFGSLRAVCMYTHTHTRTHTHIHTQTHTRFCQLRLGKPRRAVFIYKTQKCVCVFSSQEPVVIERRWFRYAVLRTCVIE